MIATPRVVGVVALILVGASYQPSNLLANEGLSEGLSDHLLTVWTEQDGLPSSRIRTIEQDSGGYLWIGTDAGLVRFDGVRFVHWDSLGRPPLPVDPIFTLLNARDGSLWIGFGGAGGIARARGRHFRLYGPEEGLPSGYVAALFEDRQGVVWAAGLRGLFAFRNETWSRLTGRDIPEGPVLAVFEDSRRRIWAATADAVFRSEDGESPFQKIATVSQCNSLFAAFSEDSHGVVWVTESRRGFRRLDGQFSPGSENGCGTQLLIASQGTAWVATQGQGLWRVNSHASDPPVVNPISISEGLPSNAIRSLLEDPEGNIWVGTHAGLLRLSPRRVTALTDLGLVRTIATTLDGSVWVGTSTGLVRFTNTGQDGPGIQYHLPSPSPAVLSLHTDKKGTLWAAVENGLMRLAGDRFVHMSLPSSSPPRQFFAITGIHEPQWFRDPYQGLFRWTGQQLVDPVDLPIHFRRTARTLYHDRGNALWIGAGDGHLGVLRPDGVFESRTLDIGHLTAIYEDSRGSLWIGGVRGLARASDKRFVTAGPASGLFKNISSIVEDEYGFLWLGGATGIMRLDPGEFDRSASDPRHEMRYTLFDASDGVAGSPIRLGSPNALRAQDGRLWFVTSGGVTIVDPRDPGPARLPPLVRIESVTADSRVIEPVPHAVLPARTGHVKIDFSAWTSVNPTRVRFRYRLDGFDRDWIEAGAARQVTYTNLAPGTYTLNVVASNRDGFWDQPANWTFSIAPAFYQTYWFYGGCLLSAVLLTVAAWKLRELRMRRQFALVLAERARMSRDIHDTLLQGLVGVALQCEDIAHQVDTSSPASDKLSLLRRRVEDYIRQARDAVLDLRSPRRDITDLQKMLRTTAERTVAGTPATLQFNVTGTPPAALSGQKQLVLIAQEALSNAVRHARPTLVSVELSCQDNRLLLRITDDGCGFDSSALPAGRLDHFGLTTMRERAALLGGTLNISTTRGAGTRVEVTVPLAASAGL